MDKSMILQRMQKVYNKLMGTDSGLLQTDMKIDEKLGMTSFALIEMAYALEDEFNITISNKALRSFRRIGDVVAYIEKELA